MIEEYVEGFKKALSDEISEIRKNGPKRIKLHDGVLLYNDTNDFTYLESSNQNIKSEIKTVYIYQFDVDDEINLPNSIPVSFYTKGKVLKGEVVSCENFVVVLSIPEYLSDKVLEAEISVEAWRLLEELKYRLDDIVVGNNGFNANIAMKLVKESKYMSRYGLEKPIVGQEVAVEKSNKEPVMFIWGPPGTGKTETLAKISILNMLQSKRILIVSHSNVAVDEAILRIIKKIDELESDELIELIDEIKEFINRGLILRLGYPRKDELRNKKEVNVSYYLTKQCRSIVKGSSLSKESFMKNNKIIKRLLSEDNDFLSDVSLIKELNRIKKVLKNDFTYDKKLTSKYISLINELIENIKIQRKELVDNSRIIGTTISKAVVDKLVYRGEYDMVLLDEASMAYIPHSFYVASLAKKQIICFGDFMQLPPIASSNDSREVKQWLLKDIFEQAGIKDLFDKENTTFHPWMVMLNEQRRMHTDISSFISFYIYKNCLKDDYSIEKRLRSKIKDEPFSNRVISFVDLRTLPSICKKDNDSSRYNLFSAFVSVHLAKISISNKNTSVGIITPYRRQAQIIKAIFADVHGNPNDYNVKISTVHQFQGSESDTIIFDCVDSYRITRPGYLLFDKELDRGDRLINVAMSRAKSKFIIIANWKYYNDRLPKTSFIYKLLNKYAVSRTSIDKETLIEYLNANSTQNLIISKKKEAIKHIEKLIKRASKQVLIFTPNNKIKNNTDFQNILDLTDKEIITIVSEKKSKNKDFMSKIVNNYFESDFVWFPMTIIDDKAIIYGWPFIESDYIREFPVVIAKNKNIKRILRQIMYCDNACNKYFKKDLSTKEDITDLKLNIKTKKILIKDDKFNDAMSINTFDNYENSVNKVKEQSFLKYINESISCYKCGKTLVLSIEQEFKRPPYIKCLNCNFKRLLDYSTLKNYVDRFDCRCKMHGSKLFVVGGQRGVYVKCKSGGGHFVDILDI